MQINFPAAGGQKTPKDISDVTNKILPQIETLQKGIGFLLKDHCPIILAMPIRNG